GGPAGAGATDDGAADSAAGGGGPAGAGATADGAADSAAVGASPANSAGPVPAANSAGPVPTGVVPAGGSYAVDGYEYPPEQTTKARPTTLDELMSVLGGSAEVMVPNPLPLPEEVQALVTERSRPNPFGQYRRYAVIQGGERVDVDVLDGDRQLVGFLANIWDSIRLRGIDRPVKPTLREGAQHGALLAFAAREAGVRAPTVRGLARSQDSILLVYNHVPGSRTFAELEETEISEEDLTEFWHQLHLAHASGIAHRALTSSHVVKDDDGKLWITGWENGEVASSELSRRMDLAQGLTMLATKVGKERALASATAALSEGELTSLAPLLQGIVMPHQTRSEIPRRFLQELRSEVLRRVPAAAEAPPLSLQRLSLRQLITISAVFAAAVILLGTFNWNEVYAAFRDANPWWLLAAFGASMLTYAGAAISLVSFTPERLGLWRTTLVQVASALVAIVAPAGVGPAAIEMRYLVKQKVKTPLAVATVTMVQVSKFITTVGLLILVTLVAGAAGGSGSVAIPSRAIMIGVGVIVALVAVVVAIPPLRTWSARQILPVLRQIWPRILWIFGNPGRLVTGLAGNVIQTVAFVAAFGLTLAAFGHELPPAILAITYLASNSAGSLVPSPAGIGPVELALTSGLTIAGIPSPVAVSATIVFRVLTLWARVPLGWPALRYLQRRDVL
ncbi:MAG TPA: UPF0104 family protein, partial [Actinomycetales bacterium]|nr:UPF0104 family protein [Actinomycetales bacterium]